MTGCEDNDREGVRTIIGCENNDREGVRTMTGRV